MAHNIDEVLLVLLSLIDDKRNDIYIHFDKKADIDHSELFASISKSHLYLTEQVSVTWGGYSQIEAELILLKTATTHERYSYYHLLSAHDLPIKNQNYIHSFFDSADGTEFVRFQSSVFGYSERVHYYYFFQELLGRKGEILKKISARIQNVFHIMRNADICFQKGDNWFSITDNLARYVVDQENWIKRVFKYSLCCDEVFLQTLIVNSSFKDKLVTDDTNTNSGIEQPELSEGNFSETRGENGR